MQLRELTRSLKEKEKYYFEVQSFLHLYSNFETWNDNLHDSQLLMGRDNSQADPMVKIVYGVGSPHNMTAYLRIYAPILVTHEWSWLVSKMWFVISKMTQTKIPQHNAKVFILNDFAVLVGFGVDSPYHVQINACWKGYCLRH